MPRPTSRSAFAHRCRRSLADAGAARKERKWTGRRNPTHPRHHASKNEAARFNPPTHSTWHRSAFAAAARACASLPCRLHRKSTRGPEARRPHAQLRRALTCPRLAAVELAMLRQCLASKTARSKRDQEAFLCLHRAHRAVWRLRSAAHRNVVCQRPSPSRQGRALAHQVHRLHQAPSRPRRASPSLDRAGMQRDHHWLPIAAARTALSASRGFASVVGGPRLPLMISPS